MKIHELKPARGSKRKKKIVGRGNASGRGTYCTRGIKGQKARAGVSFYPGFEGGRTPLVKIIPKRRGFKSIRPQWQTVNVSAIQKSFKTGEIVDKSKLQAAGLIKSKNALVKLLGAGEVKKKLTILIDACSKSAKNKIEKAGGEVKITEANKEVNGKAKENKTHGKSKRRSNKK